MPTILSIFYRPYSCGATRALALIGVDLVYSVKRVISPIYALDAVVEAAFLAWCISRGD